MFSQRYMRKAMLYAVLCYGMSGGIHRTHAAPPLYPAAQQHSCVTTPAALAAFPAAQRLTADESAQPANAPDSPNHIDILLLATQLAVTNYAGPGEDFDTSLEQLANQMEVWSNLAFRNSNVDLRAHTARAVLIEFAQYYGDPEFYVSIPTLLNDMRPDYLHTALSQDIAHWRAETASDIVLLLVGDNEEACEGSFGIPNPFHVEAADFAFSVSVVKPSRCPGYVASFAHGLGHALGLNHQRRAIPRDYLETLREQSPAYPYAYAWVPRIFEGQGWRTVMAVLGESPSHFVPRVPYFSNPDVFYENQPTGRPWADNARAANLFRNAAAQYEIENLLPVADAGTDQCLANVKDSYSVSLNGANSHPGHDDQGQEIEITQYQWTLGETHWEGRNITVNLAVGTYSFALEIRDQNGNSDVDRIFVEISSDNHCRWK